MFPPFGMRRLIPLLLVAFSISLSSCVFDGESGVGLGFRKDKSDAEATAESKEEKKGLGKLGSWFGRDKKVKEETQKPPANAMPIPQKLPIGSVHLVHKTGGFVLIRTSRTAEVDPNAEMATYDQGGRPTGKLRLSPERKGAFLVADIVEGNPQANDRVLLFGFIDQEGSLQFDTADPNQVEVLE